MAYLLGSIPAGFLVARAKGVDIRAVGSGNIGATNVFRILGKSAGICVLWLDALKGFVAVALVLNCYHKLAGIFVFIVDAAKGYVACKFVGDLGAHWFAASASISVQDYFPFIAGFTAILGHNYTCWLGFKGGKGIATSAGVLLALFPKALLVVLAIWILVFAVSRYVSLASIIGAFWLPVFVWVFGYSRQCVIIALVLTVLAIYKHKSNIERLIAGTEHRFGEKTTDSADAPIPLP
jgi:glycerol-3-phosphate acyltransferase PlsY